MQLGLHAPYFVGLDGFLHGNVFDVLRLHQLDLFGRVLVVVLVLAMLLAKCEKRTAQCTINASNVNNSDGRCKRATTYSVMDF